MKWWIKWHEEICLATYEQELLRKGSPEDAKRTVMVSMGFFDVLLVMPLAASVPVWLGVRNVSGPLMPLGILLAVLSVVLSTRALGRGLAARERSPVSPDVADARRRHWLRVMWTIVCVALLFDVGFFVLDAVVRHSR